MLFFVVSFTKSSIYLSNSFCYYLAHIPLILESFVYFFSCSHKRFILSHAWNSPAIFLQIYKGFKVENTILGFLLFYFPSMCPITFGQGNITLPGNLN